MAHGEVRHTLGNLIKMIVINVVFFHMVNVRERYLESKGSPVTRLEDPPSGNLAPPGVLEESASHHEDDIHRITLYVVYDS